MNRSYHITLARSCLASASLVFQFLCWSIETSRAIARHLLLLNAVPAFKAAKEAQIYSSAASSLLFLSCESSRCLRMKL